MRRRWHRAVVATDVLTGARRRASLARPTAEGVVVSLTSYPARIGRVHLVVGSILEQTVVPAKTVLYLAEADFPDRRIPLRLRRLVSERFEIRFQARDLRSHLKLVPAVADFPGRANVVCDDDRLYPPSWLAGFIEAAAETPNTVLCRRARRIGHRDGSPLPYGQWPRQPGDMTGLDLLALGVGGAYYPPGCLDRRLGDAELIARLAPTADDIWFKAMTLLTRTPTRRIPGSPDLPAPASRGDRPLRQINVVQRGNDPQIAAVFGHFGLAPPFGDP